MAQFSRFPSEAPLLASRPAIWTASGGQGQPVPGCCLAPNEIRDLATPKRETAANLDTSDLCEILGNHLQRNASP